MACIVETMGIALPTAASIPATHADRLRSAEASGRVAVGLAERGGPAPSALMTRAAFRNALVVLQAIGGSTNALIHLTAAAGRLGIAIDLDEVDALGREVPVLVDLKPSGQHYMEHFHWAGGVPRLLHELRDQLDLGARCVEGATLGERIANVDVRDAQDVIRSRATRSAPAAASSCCAATSRRAARSSSSRRRRRASCSTPAAPSSSIRSPTSRRGSTRPISTSAPTTSSC
jgi:dihydroxy-acid dehydratase